MCVDGLPTTPGRGTMVEPSHCALEYTPEKWLPPLPSNDGSPVFGKGTLFSFMYICRLLLMTLTLFSDWHDGGDGLSPPQLGQFDE